MRTDIGIAGTRLPAVDLREGLTTATAAIGAFLVAFVAIRRRRPVPGLAVEVEARRAAITAPDAPSIEHRRWRRTWAWLTWLMTAKVGRPELLGAVVAAALVSGATLVVIQLLAAARV